MSDKIFDLKDFYEYKENNCLEVKKAKDGLPISLWETYSSMCNTYGGVIICGVQERKDKTWYTTGLKYDDVSKLKKSFWDSINDRKKVNINLLTESDVVDYQVGEDLVLVIYVSRAPREERPVYINDNLMGGTFKRNWEGDYHCTQREVKAMLRDQADESPDMKILEDQEMSDLDYDTIKLYRANYNSHHPEAAWQKLSDEEFLIRLGAASRKTSDHKVHPTAAGLLMFGQEYQILTEFPEYFLDFREKMDPSIRWTDRVQTQSGDFSGNVYDFYRIVYRKLVADFKVPFMVKNGVRVEETPKHKAIREAMANAFVNTDYFQGWSVVIEHYPDRIVLANPGTIIPGKEQMLRGGISEPRNKVLFKMFNMIGIGDHAGSGIPDIFDVWEGEGLKEPTIDEQFGPDVPDRTTLTLPLIGKDQPFSEKGPGNEIENEKGPGKGPENELENKKGPGKGPKNELENEKGPGKIILTKNDEIDARILEIQNLIKRNPKVSRPQISNKLGFSEKQVRVALDYLKNNGYIHHEGPTKGGEYIIDKEYGK